MISYLFELAFPVVGAQLCFCILFAKFVLEPVLMPRWFGANYTRLDLINRRSFTNHVMSLALKVCIFVVGTYPWSSVFFAKRQYSARTESDHDHDPNITLGDLLAWCYLTVPVMFLFEITYRIRISLVSLIHHIASIMITIFGVVVIIANKRNGRDAKNEFRLILIYGAFEMSFEMFPHVVLIFYRIRRHQPRLLRLMFLAASISVGIGVFIEQIAIGIFYKRVWNEWTTPFIVVGLVLHCCFVVAQVHGVRLYWQLSQKMANELVEQPSPEEGKEQPCVVAAPGPETRGPETGSQETVLAAVTGT